MGKIIMKINHRKCRESRWSARLNQIMSIGLYRYRSGCWNGRGGRAPSCFSLKYNYPAFKRVGTHMPPLANENLSNALPQLSKSNPQDPNI